MATKLENAGSSAQPQQDGDKENEYIKVITKKLRALNKKLNTSIANIEKKVAAGAQINEDEKKLLDSKPSLEKEVKNYEKIRSELEKIQQEEKQGKKIKPKKEDFEGSASVSVLVSVLQAALQIKETNKSVGISKEDAEAIVTVSHFVTNFAAPNSIAVGTEHANKLLRQADEQAVAGKTYKQIVQLATQLLATPAVVQETPVVKAVEQAPKDKPNGAVHQEPVAPVEPIETKVEEAVRQSEVQPQVEEQPEEGRQDQQEVDGSKPRDQTKRNFRGRGRGGRRYKYYGDGRPREHKENREAEYKPRNGNSRGRGGPNPNKSQGQ